VRVLPQQFFLLFAEVGGDGDDRLDNLVAPPEAADVGNSLSLQPEGLAGLRAPGNFQLLRARERWCLDRGAQGRLDEGDGDAAMNVVADASEEFMVVHVDEDVQIAAGGAISAGFPLAAQPQPGAGIHTGRDLDLDALPDGFPARTPTGMAGLRNHLPVPVALGARAADAEEPAGLHDLAAAAARRTGLGTRARGRAASAAGVTMRKLFDLDVLGGAEGGIQKRDLDVIAQVGPGMDPRAGPGAPTHGAAHAKDILEYVAEAAEDILESGEATESGPAEPLVTVVVINLALLGVGQHLVSLGGLLEASLGFLVTRIAVRMVLHGELPVTPLEVFFPGITADAEYFIVTALRHVPTFRLVSNMTCLTFSARSSWPLLWKAYSAKACLPVARAASPRVFHSSAGGVSFRAFRTCW